MNSVTELLTKFLNRLRKNKQHLQNSYSQKKLTNQFKTEFDHFVELSQKATRDDLKISWSDKHMILNEKTSTTSFDHHYLYHTSWAARKLYENPVDLHTDISSCLRFNSIVSAFIPVQFFDYRPANIVLSDFSSNSADLTQLPFTDNSIGSLSCMHVIEHIGLGRYGDPIDPNGDIKAMNELIRVLSPGGNLYVVFPVGQPRVCFNAHRIYDPLQIIDYFSKLNLLEFAGVSDDGDFSRYIKPESYKNQKYACGMYHFQKERL